jgi:ABC-type Fe3+-hydroxamate transport system, periplasmic component
VPTYIDQIGRNVSIVSNPSRIISVVPSQTELLFSLGLDEQVIGITKFCVHPEQWFRSKTRIGGTKKLDIEKIKSLKPDLIVANKEENTKEQIEELAKEYPVWTSNINNLDDALLMIHETGEIVNRPKESLSLINSIRSAFNGIKHDIPLLKACYLIWKDPFITIGQDTFISHMLPYAGFENVFGYLKRYPTVTIEDIIDSKCEVVLLSSEPYPFSNKHIIEFKSQLPGIDIQLVDGEMFSWYGSRLVEAGEYFKQLKMKNVK